jgi:hypothetical protein
MDATILDNFSENSILCDVEETTTTPNTKQTNKLNNFEEFDISDIDYDPNGTFTFDDVEEDDFDYDTNNFIEKNISLLEYLDEDMADIIMLDSVLTNTANNDKKRKRE